MNVNLLTPDNTLVYVGGSVKALGEGRVGGYLVLFSTQNDPDISPARDFFTKSTDYDLERSDVSTIYYDHGRDPQLKQRKLGTGSMKIDEVGVWFDGQLNMRDRYEKAVYQLAEAGKLGWSSGTASHLVERKAVENNAHEVLKWALGLDATLTTSPAEPRLSATALKSLPTIKSLADLITENEIEIEDDGTKTVEIKAKWNAEYVNALPDSSFAYIAPGGELDDEEKTAPRKLRMFPYTDVDGKPDASHVKSALSRIPESTKLTDAAKKKALKAVEKAAKKLGLVTGATDEAKAARKGVYLDELERRYRCIYALVDVLETCLYRLDYAEDLADDYGISIDVPAAIHELFVECEAEIQGYFAEDEADEEGEKSLTTVDLALPFAKQVQFVAAIMRENTKRIAAVEAEIQDLTTRAVKQVSVPAALRGEIEDSRAGLDSMLAQMKSTSEKLVTFVNSLDPEKRATEERAEKALHNYFLLEGDIADKLSDVPS
jgi:phage head maturation protease